MAYHALAAVTREVSVKQAFDELWRLKLDRLRDELAKGEADLAAGPTTTLTDDEEIAAFFARP